MDFGAPLAFQAVPEGVQVVSVDGEPIGVLVHVLADEQTDIFDGIVIDTSSGPGGVRFVDAPEVQAIFERAIVLTITAAEAGELPEPSENAAVIQHDGVEDSEHPLSRKLRRAWDRISGRY